LENNERSVQRNQRSRQTGAVSQAVLEDSQTARDTARASVLAAKANVRQAELNLSYTTIKSPITGRIGVAAFSVGSFVGPSSGALARVVQIDPIRVVFSVNDRAILDFREGVKNFNEIKAASKFVPMLRLSNGRDYPAKGEIEFVGNEIDPATGTLPIRARFPNPEGVLVPGQFVTVIIRRSSPQARPVVPVVAVQLDREGRFVLLLDDDGKVVERRIRTGAQLGQNWIVEDGLKGGEKVIVQGFQHARPGAAVRVVPAPDAGHR
jgi:membrane fusion protein (multidrug efflux system)